MPESLLNCYTVSVSLLRPICAIFSTKQTSLQRQGVGRSGMLQCSETAAQ